MNEPILEILLQDKSTGRNIIWTTDQNAQITAEDRPKIKSRVQKSLEEQKERTQKKAEVFTPSWICNVMNNQVDEQWFGRPNVFNVPSADEKDWTPTVGKIEFPNHEPEAWKAYVESLRLEITCGEAPYLVSRYDTTSGEFLPIEKRIGLLDRKLRVVNENTETHFEWFEWTKRAFQSTYGYEFQGDNLLLARENLLNTFCEYYFARFGEEAPIEQVKEIADIIVWNIWQMDGLKDCVPLSDVECTIKDWKTGRVVKFKELKG